MILPISRRRFFGQSVGLATGALLTVGERGDPFRGRASIRRVCPEHGPASPARCGELRRRSCPARRSRCTVELSAPTHLPSAPELELPDNADPPPNLELQQN